MSVQTITKPKRHLPPTSDFDSLQQRLATSEAAARLDSRRTLVVVPSRTLEKWQEPRAETQAYEERLLCTLFELRDPAVSVTYVTSAPVAPAIVDYYLSLLPRRIRAHARSRLSLIAVGDSARRPLSEKLLARPKVLERIRRGIRDPSSSYVVPYNTTPLERDVAVQLGIPMYGADPCHAHLGTKSGCRQLFDEAGVPHPVGVEGVTTPASVVDAIVALRGAKASLNQLVIKLNEGVSGEGNAVVDISDLPVPGSPDERSLIAERVFAAAPEAPGVRMPEFLARLSARGGIVEEWITARELRSPSAQLQITPCGEVQLLSTHDQILGGRNGQSYLGCRFPAEPAYAPAISALARRVGDRLATAGVIGRFAIDFVVVGDGTGAWQPFAIELNLRKGGTTHPYETLVHLTGGSCDAGRAAFTTPTGQEKHYVATDHLEGPQLRNLGRDGVLGLARSDLKFDRMRRTGPVFHMLSSLGELGRMGFTAIGDSAEEAEALYREVTETLIAAGSASPALGAPPASVAGTMSA
jgi:PGM1 C-terminal domain